MQPGNMGFLIMALVIMYRHMKKQEKKSKGDTAKHWLKVITSLVIVMGIGWIGKIVLFDNNDRVIAYIMTGFVASQGVFIFILLVPLSKQVRDAYIDWWRKTWTRLRSTSSDHLSAKTSSPMNSKENGV